MNQPTQYLADAAPKAINRTCPKCKYIRATSEINCPDCGKVLQSVSKIRTLGVLLVASGLSLLAFMSWLALWMYNAISQTGKPGATSGFNGGEQEISFIVIVVGLVILIGLNATIAGFWQIVFGKRNKILVVTIMVLGIIFILTGLSVTTMK